MSLSSRHKVSVQFSMSGMTDIVFLLLIFFMLTSTLILPTAIDVVLPKSNNQTSTKAQTVVTITKDLKFYVNESQVSEYELESALQNKLRYKPEPALAIKPDGQVPVDALVKVLTIAKRNNYKAILATQPE